MSTYHAEEDGLCIPYFPKVLKANLVCVHAGKTPNGENLR